jgi:enoyl-CoA hydratase/carnithine racemase
VTAALARNRGCMPACNPLLAISPTKTNARLSLEPEVKVLVLTGRAKSWTAGTDLTEHFRVVTPGMLTSFPV